MNADAITESAPTKPKRRSFLKFLVLGGGLAMAGGIVNPLRVVAGDTKSPKKDTLFSGFRITENSREVTFHTKEGDELLVIEKEH